jgi:acetylornithine deacetylase
MNDDSKRAKISAAVDADSDKAIALLRDMVTSVTGDEARIQHYLQDVRYGMRLIVDMWEVDWSKLQRDPGYRPVDRGYEDRPNIVARLARSGRSRSLLLNGHTDAIPVGNGEGWNEESLVCLDQGWPHVMADGPPT